MKEGENGRLVDWKAAKEHLLDSLSWPLPLHTTLFGSLRTTATSFCLSLAIRQKTPRIAAKVQRHSWTVNYLAVVLYTLHCSSREYSQTPLIPLLLERHLSRCLTHT